MAEEGLSLARSFGSAREIEVFGALTIYGIACFTCGKLEKAEEYFTQSMTLAEKLHAHLYIVHLYLGIIYEVLKGYDKAEHFYQLSRMEAHQAGYNYFTCGALTSLTRVKHTRNNFADILPLWTEAEHLAQQYEYNDYFTSLYLIRGHISWDGLIPEWGDGFDTALHYYQLTLVHALRFNRFLLDESLSGREQVTPLRPIIPHCLERGKDGQRMLAALQDWWQTGINNTGTSRSDSISSLSESITLLEAESIARHREPGDGSAQKDVVEQINAALIAGDKD